MSEHITHHLTCRALCQGSAIVNFRNVFSVDADFQYSVDNPAFVLAKSGERLAAKKPASLGISYHRPEGSSGPSVGKLTVSCPKHTATQWIFYLQA
jgi:hypothetical protein